MLTTFSKLYDSVFTKDNVLALERFTLLTAVFIFLIHILLVFIDKNYDVLPSQLDIIEQNYLSTISTPFTMILFFEIFLLVLAIPKSITEAIALQYEIISLVFIRRVFKDISQLESVTDLFGQFEVFKSVILDMAGGLSLFFLIAVFYYATRKISKEKEEFHKTLVLLKKSVSIFVAAFLFFLGGFYFFYWIYDVSDGLPINSNYITDFFETFFVLLILIDIVVVIISFIYKEQYGIIFRDAGYIISIIFIRLAFTTPKPYDIIVAIVGVIFGILLSFIFSLYKMFKIKEELI